MSGAYTHVKSEGPLDARIVILGESPWKSEVATGRPFAGASGNLLKRWWGQIEGEQFDPMGYVVSVDFDIRPHDPTHLTRSNIRMMNLFPYRPPRRDIGSVPTDKLIEAIGKIHERVAKLADPYVIVTTGNYATFALTGKGNVRADVRRAFTHDTVTEAEKHAGITALRGSIYPYRDLNGRIIKVIPTIHPAGVLQMAKWEKRSIVDWERIKREAGYKEIREPHREHIIWPKNWQIEEFCHEVEMQKESGKMAVDIETWGSQLTCIGFALTPYKSITLPLFGDWKERLTPFAKWLCEHSIAKTLCNGSYDWYWLDAEGIQLVNYLRDVQCLKGETEVLTRKGWMKLETLWNKNSGQDVLQWHKNGELSWTQATKISEFFFGNLYKVDTPKHQCSYTPNHRIPFLWQSNKKLSVKTAKDWARLEAVYLPNAGNLKGCESVTTDAIKLLVAIQADGSWSSNCVYFEFVKKRKVDKIQEIVNKLERASITELKRNTKKRSRKFKISGPLVDEIYRMIGRNKLFGSWLLTWTSKCRSVFIEELRYWDGVYNSKYINYTSKHKKNVEWVATVAHTINKSAYVYETGNKRAWSVNIKDKNYISHRKHNLSKEPFVGRVYCLSVPSSYFLIRSNGQILITGNSMHHALDPAENHSLNFLASILCDHYVYWKDEAKEAEEIIKYAKDLDALFVYNGLDCCYTRELDDILEAKLRAEGMWDFYMQHYAMMFEPLLRTMRHGIRVDVDKQKAYAKRLRAEMKEIHAKLNELAGFELFATEEKTAWRDPTAKEWEALATQEFKEAHAGESVLRVTVKWGIPKAKYIDRKARKDLVLQGLTYMITGQNAGRVRYKTTKTKKDFSKDKLSEFFYGSKGLSLPKQYVWSKDKYGAKKRKESLNEDSIRKLMNKFVRAVEPGKLLLQFREKKRELDYVKGSWDKDGRMRCSYKMLTRAGRLSSSKNPMRRGYNLQNLKR